MSEAINNQPRLTPPAIPAPRTQETGGSNRTSAPASVNANDAKANKESIRESLEIVVKARDGANAKLTEQTKFNEGDLYAALVHHRLKQTNPEAAAQYAAELPQALQRNRSERGEPLSFRAAESVLRKLADEGAISKDEFRSTRSYAFDRAQLDSDRTRIGTGALNEGGQTASINELLRFLLLNPDATPEEIAAFQAGQQEAAPATAATGAKAAASSGPASPKGPSVGVDAPRGFLWKPVSDSTGKLAILLPPGMSKNAQSVTILSPDGKTQLASGKNTGIGNGDRAHFRFDKPGSAFPEGAIVQITDKSGNVTNVTIKDPAIRNEGTK